MTETMPHTHELKCWPEYFTHIRDLDKCFEIRQDDREFIAGDSILLKEWDAETEKYTGRVESGDITYVFPHRVKFQLVANGSWINGVVFGIDLN